MIEDTLKKNPGMLETYRAYARVERAFEAVLAADKEFVKFVAGNDHNLMLKLEERLTALSARLNETRLHLKQCLKNEEILRAEAGIPPLETKVLQGAQEFLKNHEYVLNEKCGLTCH